jgi:pachytene checkpoint protein 2
MKQEIWSCDERVLLIVRRFCATAMTALTDIAMDNEQLKIWTVHSKAVQKSSETSANLSPVEVRVSRTAKVRFDTIKSHVHSYLTSSFDRISLPSTLEGWEDLPLLASTVERITASESASPSLSLPLEQTSLQIHIYQPSDTDAFDEFSNGTKDGEGEEVMAASVCELPNLGLEGLWDSLIYADNVKMKLLDYIHATLVLSDADVDCEWPCYYSIYY